MQCNPMQRKAKRSIKNHGSAKEKNRAPQHVTACHDASSIVHSILCSIACSNVFSYAFCSGVSFAFYIARSIDIVSLLAFPLEKKGNL